MGDEDILHEVGPAHVRITKGFCHETLVRFNGLQSVTHITAGPDNEFGKVATMSHHENIRFEAYKEI